MKVGVFADVDDVLGALGVEHVAGGATELVAVRGRCAGGDGQVVEMPTAHETLSLTTGDVGKKDSGQNMLVKYSCRESNTLSNSPLLATP